MGIGPAFSFARCPPSCPRYLIDSGSPAGSNHHGCGHRILSPVRLGSPVFLLVCQLDFHQSVYGTGDSKLQNRLFKQDPADIAECPAFPLGDPFEFPAQVFANSDLYFPLAHQSHL